jgi:restriction system protein
MKRFFKVMLGRGSVFADKAHSGGYIGVRFIHDYNFSEIGIVPDNSREFNGKYVPLYLKERPDKTKGGAIQACSQLWTFLKGIDIGDIVISPVAKGSNIYMVGEIIGDYEYHKGADLMHRRKVKWFTEIDRNSMSQDLKRASSGVKTVTNLDKYASELDSLITTL